MKDEYKKDIKVGMISLGCAKNRVDAEIMLGLVKNAGYTITTGEDDADVVIINTCGFIDSAKEEAIDAILETSKLKTEGNLKGIIVSGCLAQRFGIEIVKSMPEVDGILGAYSFEDICSTIDAVLLKSRIHTCDSDKKLSILSRSNICYYDDTIKLDLKYLDNERVLTTPRSYAYLKIAEGCSNKCTYCAIPGIRGPFRSRTLESVVTEAKTLNDQKIPEIVVVAQDTTMYGRDINDGKSLLPALIEELDKLDNVKRVRILYLYPDEVTDEIIKAIKNSKKVVRYFDIPLQHISNHVLKRMNRRGNGNMYREVIKKFRKEMPNCVIRTSLITGFPGETEDDHLELLDFIKEYKLDRVGVFAYSKEEGTPASKLKEQIPSQTKKKRLKALMTAQQIISKEKNEKRIGKKYEVIVDSVSEDGLFYVGRSFMEAPEEDGKIYFTALDEHDIGDVVNVKILIAEEYDLTGIEVL